MPVTITIPSIAAVMLTPNPAIINQPVAAQVTISETNETLYERYQICGVARCGGGF